MPAIFSVGPWTAHEFVRFIKAVSIPIILLFCFIIYHRTLAGQRATVYTIGAMFFILLVALCMDEWNILLNFLHSIGWE